MRYDKEHSKEIIFPLGGIGTGTISFSLNKMELGQGNNSC